MPPARVSARDLFPDRRRRLRRLVAVCVCAIVALGAAAAPASAATGTVRTAGSALTVRSTPSTSATVLRSVANGSTITISCQTYGTTVTGTYGTTNVWDKLSTGGYVSDAYVFTGSDGLVAPLCSDARTLPRDLQLSTKGAAMLATFEGFRSRAYHDAGGNCTIGYGHLLRKSPCTTTDKALVWTEAKARTQMIADANRLAGGIKPYIASTRLTQYEWDALVSWTYNFGPGKFPGTGLDAALSATPPRYTSVPTELKKWVHSNGIPLCGLYKRRVNEGRVFTTGSYTLSTTITCPAGYR